MNAPTWLISAAVKVTHQCRPRFVDKAASSRSATSWTSAGTQRAPSVNSVHRRRYASSVAEAGQGSARYDPILTFGLGSWQVQRLRWKLNLIQELDEKLSKDPMPLPRRIDTAAIPEFAWRKVEVSGHYDHNKEIVLGPRTREGVLGYQVITPLVQTEDVGEPTSILVNRGHVAFAKKNQADRPESLSSGEQRVTGMLRDQEKRNMFTPPNRPEKGEYQFMDIQQIATVAGSQPVLVDQIFEGNAGEMKSMVAHGVPLGRPPTIELRNMHLTYAITWYSLSAATTVMLWRLFRRPVKANRFVKFER